MTSTSCGPSSRKPRQKIPDRSPERHTDAAGTNDSAGQRRPADRSHHSIRLRSPGLSVQLPTRRRSRHVISAFSTASASRLVMYAVPSKVWPPRRHRAGRSERCSRAQVPSPGMAAGPPHAWRIGSLARGPLRRFSLGARCDAEGWCRRLLRGSGIQACLLELLTADVHLAICDKPC